jgi:hypothetical protein
VRHVRALAPQSRAHHRGGQQDRANLAATAAPRSGVSRPARSSPKNSRCRSTKYTGCWQSPIGRSVRRRGSGRGEVGEESSRLTQQKP